MTPHGRNKAKRLLDLEKPLYARRRLETHGHSYAMGEPVPWRDIGISRLTIERWFRLRIVSHFPGGDQSQKRELTQVQIDRREGRTDKDGKRLGGPTMEEFVEAGYEASDYPPLGFAVVSSDMYDAYLEQLTAPQE